MEAIVIETSNIRETELAITVMTVPVGGNIPGIWGRVGSIYETIRASIVVGLQSPVIVPPNLSCLVVRDPRYVVAFTGISERK